MTTKEAAAAAALVAVHASSYVRVSACAFAACAAGGFHLFNLRLRSLPPVPVQLQLLIQLLWQLA